MLIIHIVLNLNNKEGNLENIFLCALKVVDSSMYRIQNQELFKYATIVFNGEWIEDMPIVNKIGDIVRIQKALQKTDDKQILFFVDKKANWCLFQSQTTFDDDIQIFDNYIDESINTAKEHKLYKHSGKNFTFEEKEGNILSELRKWNEEFFNTEIPKSILLGFSSSKKERNMLCKVFKIYEKDEYYIIFIKEWGEKTLWKFQIDKIKFQSLQNSDIIRIKSASLKNEPILKILPQTNILKFKQNWEIVKYLQENITEINLSIFWETEEPEKQTFVTKITKKLKSF